MNTDSSPESFEQAAADHEPYVPANRHDVAELTWSAVIVGAVLGIVFGASSVYLVLKVGMTVSASIPIAVLSITLFRIFTRTPGLRRIFTRDATILENNIVQTTGSAGESIAFGVGVTMPALMILGYNLEITRVILVAILGGLLGILMMIPLRRAFIVKQHGKLTYPEGTACADVLIVGEQGGTSAKTVFAGFGIAFAYQFLMDAFKLWIKEPVWRMWRERPGGGYVGFRGAIVSGELSPALLGVGYIIGTRISCIMVAGGILASWVLVPAIMMFGSGLARPLYPGLKPIGEMDLDEIWHDYVLYIGAGAVAAGGIISMLRAMPLILSSIGAGLRDIGGGARNHRLNGGIPRTERDLPMWVVVLGSLGLVAAIWAIPMFHMNPIGAGLIVLFGFLFVTVSSRLTGEIGSSSNPISGMTVATLLMTCLVFLYMGWTSDAFKLTALSIAGIVCIAASNGGTTSQDLKTGYLVGATPKAQQLSILVGALTSALVIGGTLLLLNDSGTVYSRKELPSATIAIPADALRERVKQGQYAAEDKSEYFAVHVKSEQIAGVPAGKYLIDESGRAQYLVDPGINGKLPKQDNGAAVEKFKAPKAALMSFIIDGILSRKMPWALVLLGVAIALVLELIGVPSLPFAVGVYLPLSASTPIFVGGMARWLIDKWKRRSAAEGEMSPGVLVCSGYIAGGTIAGITAALLGIRWSMNALALPGEAPEMRGWLDRWTTGGSLLHVRDWLAAHIGDPTFSLYPFGFLVLLLLLVGGELLLRQRRASSLTEG